GLVAIGKSVSRVIEDDDLVARLEERRHERAELRAAPAPSMARHDRGTPGVAEAPHGKPRVGRDHVEALARREEFPFARRVRETRGRGEESRRRIDRAFRRKHGGDAEMHAIPREGEAITNVRAIY